MKFSIIDTWQVSEYASRSGHASVTQGSVENSPSYMLDRVLSILVLSMLGLEDTCYTWFCVLCSVVLCHLSYKGFWIKYFIVYIWQGSEYTTVSKYVRVLNILGFSICQVSQENTTSYRFLTGYWLSLRFCIYQGSKYARVTQGS